MRDCRDDVIDEQGNWGYLIVLVGSATILGLYLSAVWLSLKGVNIL